MKQKLFTKNFTLLILGQVSSLFGNFILKFALSMYVLEVTGSATIFAGILAAATIPTILLSPLGGILADRVNRKKIMVALDAMSCLLVTGAVLFFPANGGLAVISVLLVGLSVLGAFESPTVQASVPQMLEGGNLIRGNAVVNQVAAIAGLLAPILGSALYVAFGVRPVMIATAICFLVTAILECFIRLENVATDHSGTVLEIVKNDFTVSMRFMGKEQPGILKLLLLAAFINFLGTGIGMVGFPFLVRNILGLSAQYYGAAQSIMGLFTILGSIAAGLLTQKLKISQLNRFLTAMGVCLAPMGVVFLLPTGTMVRYLVSLAAICGIQVASCILSIFALSLIQQKTPNQLLGKVMAYVATISMCAMPFGQTIFGFLFDRLANHSYWIFLPLAVILAAVGVSSKGFFKKLGSDTAPPSSQELSAEGKGTISA